LVVLSFLLLVPADRNIIHGSDSVESAKREIALWFPEGTHFYQATIAPWIYE
jgi:nucleoside-diphosphate kinase